LGPELENGLIASSPSEMGAAAQQQTGSSEQGDEAA
jgi:hypothetical protein